MNLVGHMKVPEGELTQLTQIGRYDISNREAVHRTAFDLDATSGSDGIVSVLLPVGHSLDPASMSHLGH